MWRNASPSRLSLCLCPSRFALSSPSLRTRYLYLFLLFLLLLLSGVRQKRQEHLQTLCPLARLLQTPIPISYLVVWQIATLRAPPLRSNTRDRTKACSLLARSPILLYLFQIKNLDMRGTHRARARSLSLHIAERYSLRFRLLLPSSVSLPCLSYPLFPGRSIPMVHRIADMLTPARLLNRAVSSLIALHPTQGSLRDTEYHIAPAQWANKHQK